MENLNLEAQKVLSQTEPIVCAECGCDRFVEVTLLRRVSKLIIGAAEDGVFPIPTFACQKCGHINKEFLPKGLEKKEEPKSGLITNI